MSDPRRPWPRRPGDETIILDVTNSYECYCVSRDEAERYQAEVNALDLKTPEGRQMRIILLAKRDAASRIARIVRYGRRNVDHNGGGF